MASFPYNVFEQTMNILFNKKEKYQKDGKESTKKLFEKQAQPIEKETEYKSDGVFEFPSIFGLFRKNPESDTNTNKSDPLVQTNGQPSQQPTEQPSQEPAEPVEPAEPTKEIVVDETILKGTKMYYDMRRQKEYALK